MKRPLLAAALLASFVASANRFDEYVSGSETVKLGHVFPLLDGGCAVQATGTFANVDGGVVTEDSKYTELSGANRTACLDVLTRMKALFKADKGL